MLASRGTTLVGQILFLCLLVGCTQRSAMQTAFEFEHPQAAPPPASQTTLLPVRMNPRQPAEPEFKSASLASPLDALRIVPALRSISAVTDFAALPGNEFTAGLQNSVTALGDLAEFDANWEPAAAAPAGLSYAVYGFTIPAGFTGEPTCSLAWLTEQSPLVAGDAWIGLSNWETGTWDWYQYEPDGVVTYPPNKQYARLADGRLLVTVVLTGQQTCLLDRVSIGAPELRATGLEDNEVQAPPSTPPIYVPKGASEVLPSSVDLSAGCSAVNDQGSWGACTCFATADGALNYELNRLYADYGWDLANDFNRASPKHLYIESGKRQGFPPDPSQGRWTDQVIDGLLTHGVASEQNALYDLVYDDDWSPDALDDAALLTISNWLEIPCNGSSGLQSVKAVLAYDEQPLVMRINVDYWFTYYEPGDVWDYTGPSYGGHAMLVVGYDDSKQAFKVRNSWSSDWGDQGYLWIGYPTFSNELAYVRCYTLACDFSNEVAQRFTGQLSALPPPTGLQAADGDDDLAIQLSWTKSAPATGYRVYRDSRASMVAEIGNIGYWSDRSVHDNFSHMYWVTAVNGTAESSFGAPDLGFLAQAPVIQYISPLSGRAGREVAFIGAVSGSGLLTYSWDFGGAATVQTSDEAVPLVTLAAIGEYTVSLAVQSPWGTDSLQVPFTVFPGNPPLAELQADRTWGRTPLTVNFDASGSYDPDGAIIQYEWDFDYDGTSDQTTAVPQVSHEYQVIGSTTCLVRVTDNTGLSDTVGRNLSVLSPDNLMPTLWWAGDTLGPPPVGKCFYVSDAYDQDGEIVLYEYDLDGDGIYEQSGHLTQATHTYTEHATLTVKCRVTDNEGGVTTQEAVLKVGNGGVPTDWVIHAIEDFDSNQNMMARVALVAGMPVVLARQDDNGALYSYFSTVAEPDSTNDWIRYTVESGLFVNNSIALCAANGAPVAVYKASNGLTYARFDGSVWQKHVITAADTARLDAAEINGVPCVAFMQGVTLRFARATTATPASSADWQVMDVSTTNDVGGGLSLGAAGTIPIIAFGQRDASSPKLAFARATATDPSLATDWTWHFIESVTDTSDFISIGLVGGNPAIAYAERSGENSLRLARADSTTPSAIGDWTIQVIENQTTITDVRLRSLSGLPAIGYIGGGGWPAVSLAESTTADPTVSGDWTISRHSDRANLEDLLNVQDKPTLIYFDRNTFTLYYYNRTL